MSKKLALAYGIYFVAFAFAISGSLSAQTNPAPADDSKTAPVKAVPVMDGGAGPCTADITVTDAAGAPVYAAKVNVHIAYGFMNVRKLDLEAGTNADGKLRFIGLPERIKHGIYFRASEGDRSGEAFDDPANTCQAHFTITLQKKP
jgi:hypothetical protein